MKRPMCYPNKKSMTKEKEREIRNPTTLLPSIMITYLPPMPSLWYPLVKPPVSMGWIIPN
jgi:hypothetical protein